MVPYGSPVMTAATTGAAEPARRGSGCMWAVIGGLGCMALLVVPILIAVVMGMTSFAQVTDSIFGIFRSEPPRAVINTSPSIVTSVRDLGQLVSISVQMAKADIRVGIQDNGALNACGYAANHVAQGAIEAGIDLTRVRDEDIAYNAATNTYTINLPAPQLTSCRVDYIRQYDRTTTVCSVDWDEARLLASYTALNEFRDDAIEGGILDEARDNARAVVTQFVAAVTGVSANGAGATVIVTFAEPNTSVPPQSCAPAAPTGWVYSPMIGAWVRGG